MPRKIEDLTILLVDDTDNARKLMIRVLSEMGVGSILEADNAVRGYREFRRNAGQVDLIICDWLMPQISGLEFLKRMQTLHPEVPFVMVTANGDLESVKSARANGVAGYIVKPYSPRQVQEKLAAIVEALPG